MRILNQTTRHWYTFRVARAVRASPQPLPFVRMAHATREGRVKICMNVIGFDLDDLLVGSSQEETVEDERSVRATSRREAISASQENSFVAHTPL